MSNLKFVMLGNIIIKCTFFVCVTVAAVYFGNAKILWWYVLALFINYGYRHEGA